VGRRLKNKNADYAGWKGVIELFEENSSGKTLLLIVGAGAAGKSTLTRALCGTGGEEHNTALLCHDCRSGKQVLERVTYSLFPNGMAIAGNLKNGSDSISRMDALRRLVNLCWAKRDIVVVDTVRATHKFVRWLHEHPLQPAAIFVYVSPPLDTNLARLRGRRSARGIVEAELPPRTFWHVFSFRSRARSVWNYARQHYRRQPVRFIEITDGTPEQVAERVFEIVRGLPQGRV
jgi:energy-coupling factor transporter ATP-binding protein EcfA2